MGWWLSGGVAGGWWGSRWDTGAAGAVEEYSAYYLLKRGSFPSPIPHTL